MLKSFFQGLIILVTSLSFAQYEIDTLYPVHSLDHILKVYPDSLDLYTPISLLEDAPSNFLKGDQLPRFLEVGVTYWGKLRLKTKQPLKGWTLHFEDKNIGPPAWTKSNGKIEVYAYLDNELLFVQKTGVEYSKKERSYKGHWAMNAILLDKLPSNEVIDLVIKIKGNSMGYPAYFNISARHPEQPYYHQYNQFNHSFNMFLFGVTFIALIYHLLQFLYLKQRIFLWFTLWLLFCTLTQAMGVGLILDTIFTLKYPIWFLIANGIFYTFWFFGRSFIQSKKKFPKLDKVILGLILFVLLENILTALYVALFNPKISFLGTGSHFRILGIYTVVSLFVSLVLAFKKDLFARYFGVGSVVVSIWLIIGTLWSLRIISPPFGLDPYATGIFFQIVIYSFGIAYRQQKITQNSQDKRLEAERNKNEMLRIQDLDKLKTRFFTNISHEFRTPLTLIQGPLELANQTNKEGEDITLTSKDFEIVKRNSTRIQTLVDELLELSKLEGGGAKLKVKKGNIIAPIKAMVYSFESMASRSDITFEVIFPEKEVVGYFDSNRLEKVVNNLMSNAFKYTSSGGIVGFELKVIQDDIHFSVRDTGKGISKEDVPHVFDRFYRVEGSEEKGSGIGLALTKELVELHGGKVSLQSEVGVGTIFNVVLPISLDRLPDSVVMDSKIEEKRLNGSTGELPNVKVVSRQNGSLGLPTALIVEDNADLRQYIFNILKEKYTILVAENGLEGETIAMKHMPDIIVSDVMMPKKNGIELCGALKTNIKTSHIPIILLTAKAGHSNKMEGLEQGADAYLTKPFKPDELLVRMENLRALREKVWEKVKNTEGLLVNNLELNSMDNQFIQRVIKVINDHIDDSTFSVESLSKTVGFSRGQLHRKLKALLNISPNHLIAEIRLNKAKQLLKNKTGSISEVAYEVGFSNLSYFSKSFKEKFGKAPSEV